MSKESNLNKNSGSMSMEERSKIARIIKLVRFSQRLGQKDFSDKHSITQSTLSKLESGSLEITAGLYRDLKKDYGVKEVEFDLGVLDKEKKVGEVKDLKEEDVSFYKIPKKYAMSCGSGARSSIPLVNYFIAKHGEKKWEDFLVHKGFKSRAKYYFYDFGHKINIHFNIDLMRELAKKEKKKKDDFFFNVAQFGKNLETHGALSAYYLKKSTFPDLIGSIIKNTVKYDNNMTYELLDVYSDRVYVSVRPREHLEEGDFYDDDLGDVFNLYRGYYLESFCGLLNLERTVKVKSQESFKKTGRWLYEASFC